MSKNEKLATQFPSMSKTTDIASTTGNTTTTVTTSNVCSTPEFKIVPSEANSAAQQHNVHRLNIVEKSLQSLEQSMAKFLNQNSDSNRPRSRYSRSRSRSRSHSRGRSRHRRDNHHKYLRRSRSPYNRERDYYYSSRRSPSYYRRSLSFEEEDRLSIAASQSDPDNSPENEAEKSDQQQIDAEKEVLTENILAHASKVNDRMEETESAQQTKMFAKINKTNLVPEDQGPAISGQLAEVAKQYWVEQSHKDPVVAKIAEKFNKTPSNCSFVKVPILNSEIASNRKILPYHKRADKRMADIQRAIKSGALAVLEMADTALKYVDGPNDNQHVDTKKFVSLGIDAITVLGKAVHMISTERKEKLRPALNEDIRSICDNDYTTSDYLFGDNISESIKIAKENFRLKQNLTHNKISSNSKQKTSSSSYRTGHKQHRSDRYDTGASASYSSKASLNSQGRKKNYVSKPRNSKYRKN